MNARGRPPRTVIHERLEREVQELRERHGGLPRPEEAGEIWSRIWHQEAHNSTAIEGNTLVLREVQRLLESGKTVGRKDLKEYLEVKGYAEAARWIYEQGHRGVDANILTIQEVRNVHALTVSLVWDVEPPPNATPEESPGNWRRHNIQPFASGMKPPDFTRIQSSVDDWVAKVNRVREGHGPIALRVAQLHAEFERIHPFLDGNGRTGRLLMNLIFVRLGYPPALIRNRSRKAYLRALNRADRGDSAALGELVARSVLDSLMQFVLPAVAGDVKLLPLESLVTRGMTFRALDNAARRGRLRAIRSDDGVWRSSRQWVRDYRRSRWAALRLPRPSKSVVSGGARRANDGNE